MINLTDITTAIYTRINENTDLMTLGCTVERSNRINFDPSRCPWVGVYPGIVDTQPRTMGGRQWQDSLEVQVVVQAMSMEDDGSEASDALERIIELVMEELGGSGKDLTLGIAGLRMLSFSREYRYVMFDEDGSGSLFMPQAVIRIKIETRS